MLSPSFITRGRMEARKAALILMKNSQFDRTLWYFWAVTGKLFFVGSKLRVTSEIIQGPRSLFNIQQYIIAGGKQYINANICFWPSSSNSLYHYSTCHRTRKAIKFIKQILAGMKLFIVPVTTSSIRCRKVLQFQFDDKWIVIF